MIETIKGIIEVVKLAIWELWELAKAIVEIFL